MKILISILFSTVSFFCVAQVPQLVVPKGHSGDVSVLAISASNKFIASGGKDQTVILWDLASGKELKTFDGYTNWINSIAISPDNKKMVSGSSEELRINDLSQGGKEIFKQKAHQSNISAIAFSSDGSLMATTSYLKNADPRGQDIEIIIWHFADMTKVKRILFNGEGASEIRFENNNQLLYVGANKIYAININLASVTKAQVIIDEGEYGSYSLSPDGKWIASYDYDNTEVPDVFGFPGKVGAIVKIFDRETLKKVKVFNAAKEQIRTIKFSRDSKYIVAAASDGIYEYSLESMMQVAKIVYKIGWPESVEYTADNKNVIVGGKDKLIRIWNLDNGKVEQKLGSVANGIIDITLRPNGQSLAITSNGGVQVFNLKRGVITNQYNHEYVQYSPNGQYLVMGSYGKNLESRNADTGENSGEFSGSMSTSVFAVSPDNNLIVSSQGLDSKEIIVRSFPSGNILNTFTLPSKASAFTFAPDGESLYVGLFAGDKTIRIDIKTGRVIQSFYHPGEIPKGFTAIPKAIKKIIVIKNGAEIITADQYSNLRWWNTATGKEVRESNFNKDFTAMVVLPGDKKLLLSGGREVLPKPTISLIDADTKKEMQQLAGHTNSPNSLALSASGKFLFSGSFDRTVRIWNVADGKLLGSMVFFEGTDWVIVDNDGRFDGTQEGMKKLYYVKGLETIPLESGYEQFYTPHLLARVLEGEDFTPVPVNIITRKDAPKVKIAAEQIKRNLTVEDDVSVFYSEAAEVNIKVQADCPSDGVSEMRLFQNSKLVETTRNLTVEDENTFQKSSVKTFAVKLLPGENKFKAIAFNTERTESKPAELIVSFKSITKDEPVKPASTLHLIVVGINAYKNPKYNLNYALADATAFVDALTKGSKDLFTTTNTIFIKDADATKDGMTAVFEKVKAVAMPEDLFVFYFAGHGVINDKKEFFLVPSDVVQLYGNDEALAQKGFSAGNLQEMSKNIKAQKQLFILDACQSAGALTAVAGARGAAEEKAISQLARATGTYWLTASGSEQLASEFEEIGHGSFTYCLLQAFKGEANPGDKKLTVKILDAYLQTKVPEVTQKYKGTAQYPVSYSYGNDFPIIIVQ